jgi:hypothetical protein
MRSLTAVDKVEGKTAVARLCGAISPDTMVGQLAL